MVRMIRGDVVARERVTSHFQNFTIYAAAPIFGILGHLAAGESVHFDVLHTGLPSNGWATLMLTSVLK